MLALHARVHGVRPQDLHDPSLVQVWGPRGAIYLVPASDRAVFTVGLTPRDADASSVLEAASPALAQVIRSSAAGDEIPPAVVGSTRDARLAASISGRVLVRWDGSSISCVVGDAPEMSAAAARRALARRFMQLFGPVEPGQFARWSGVRPADARATFEELRDETVRVEVEGEPRVMHADDVHELGESSHPEVVRLLPPGDPYLTAPDRDAIVVDDQLRSALWPRSVPPGAILIGEEIVGTWRRRGNEVTVGPMRSLVRARRDAIENEASMMPVEGNVTVSWTGPAT